MSGGHYLTPEQMVEVQDVSAESLAARCGIDENGPLADETRSEAERSDSVKMQLGVLQRRPRPLSDPIYCKTAARYLPALMKAFEATETLQSASLPVINVVTYTPYFVRFARTPAGQSITSLLAKRIIAQGKDVPVRDEAAEAAQFLATVALLQGFDDLEEDDEKKLMSTLRLWHRKHKGTFAGETTERCITLLEGRPEDEEMYSAVRAKICAGVDECGAPMCSRKTTETGGNLLRCSRCKTAVYCSAEHQKISWATHKGSCFSPAF